MKMGKYLSGDNGRVFYWSLLRHTGGKRLPITISISSNERGKPRLNLY